MYDSNTQRITGIDQKTQIAFKDKTEISNRNSSIADFCCARSMASIFDGGSPLWGLSVVNH